jgi:hypothetical protein
MSNLKSKDFPKYVRDKNPNLDVMLERTRKEDVYLSINSFFGFVTVEQRSQIRKRTIEQNSKF